MYIYIYKYKIIEFLSDFAYKYKTPFREIFFFLKKIYKHNIATKSSSLYGQKIPLKFSFLEYFEYFFLCYFSRKCGHQKGRP